MSTTQVKYDGQPQPEQGPYIVPAGGAPPQYSGYPAPPAAAPNVVIVQGGGGLSCPGCQATGSYVPTSTAGWKFQLAGCYMWLGLIGCSIGFALDKPRKCASCGFEESGTKGRGMCLFFSGLFWHIGVFVAVIVIVVVYINKAKDSINNDYPY